MLNLVALFIALTCFEGANDRTESTLVAQSTYFGADILHETRKRSFLENIIIFFLVSLKAMEIPANAVSLMTDNVKATSTRQDVGWIQLEKHFPKIWQQNENAIHR